MNERGEVTLMSCFLIFILMSIVLICGLELRRSYKQIQKRTKLFLCVKETKGEFHEFMTFMGQTNWGIKNLNRVSIITLFIPGLQGISTNADRAKKLLKYVQEGRSILYLKTLKDLQKERGCPIDPRMYFTPFKIGSRLFKRDGEGALILRENVWSYYFLLKPYVLDLKVDSANWERPKSKMTYQASEKGAKLSSLLSSHF